MTSRMRISVTGVSGMMVRMRNAKKNARKARETGSRVRGMSSSRMSVNDVGSRVSLSRRSFNTTWTKAIGVKSIDRGVRGRRRRNRRSRNRERRDKERGRKVRGARSNVRGGSRRSSGVGGGSEKVEVVVVMMAAELV